MFRLFTIISPDVRLSPAMQITTDMQRFFTEVAKEPPDLKSLGVKSRPLESVIPHLRPIHASTTNAVSSMQMDCRELAKSLLLIW